MTGRLQSPCKGCELRSAACHKAGRCPAWTAFTAQRAAEQAEKTACVKAQADVRAVRTQQGKWAQAKRKGWG